MSTVNDSPKKKKKASAPETEVVAEEVVENAADQPIEIESFTPMTDEVPDNMYAPIEGTATGELNTDPPVYQLPAVVEFEKVSFETYVNAFKPIYLEIAKAQSNAGEPYGYKEEEMIDSAKLVYDRILLPRRSSRQGATYSIPFPFPEAELKPGTSILVPTGIKAKCMPGWAVVVLPARAVGSKFRIQLDATVEVYDEEYYNNQYNEGHIILQFTNDTKDGYTAVLSAGDVIARAIVVPFGISESDEDQQKEMDTYVEQQAMRALQEEHEQHEHMHEHDHPHTH